MLRKSIHTRLLFIVVGLISVGVAISIYWGMRSEETRFLDEKVKASGFIAKPVLAALYGGLFEERPDMVVHLVNTLGAMQGRGSLFIVRDNGSEEAFKDLKTIQAVQKKTGIYKPEWASERKDAAHNVAAGTGSAKFKAALDGFRRNWAAPPVYYVEKDERGPILAYLQPIEGKDRCFKCHGHDGARGILVVRTKLDEMYSSLNRIRNQWIATGIVGVAITGMLLSMLISRYITGPIKKTVGVIKNIAEGSADISERVEVINSKDEIGYLSTTFNNMLDTLEKREADNRKLFDMVTASKGEWIATFDAIQDLISIHDRDYRVLKVNKALANKLNVKPKDLTGLKCHDVFYGKDSPKHTCPHAQTLSTGELTHQEADDMVFEGTYMVTTFPIKNDDGQIWGTVHVARDITQDKFLRDQLFHAEKLSSVGKLVAGIAHELNNPLMGIMGFSQLLMDMPGDKPVSDAKEKIRRIYQESLRTAKIVQNLLAFARAKKSEREYHNINDILKQTVDLRDYSLRSNNIRLTLDLDPELPKTMVDLFQMQQVFINLINNAEDAIVSTKRKDGLMEIKTRTTRRKIEITVRDNGIGVPKEILGKVFDPFFTTKEVGKGTGLGLSITHGIVTEHGGEIGIDSPENGGTTVSMTIPVVDKAQWTEVSKTVSNAAGKEINAAGKKILIVDDEASIREALSDILIKEGFKVDTAGDGVEAIKNLEKARYALVITDIKMSGLDGHELHASILRSHSYLKNKIIVVTGDVFNKDVKEFLERTNCPHVLKPFEPKLLLDLIRQVL